MKHKYSHSYLLHLSGLQQKGSPKTMPSISQNTENVLRYSSPSRNAVVGYPFLNHQISSRVGLKHVCRQREGLITCQNKENWLCSPWQWAKGRYIQRVVTARQGFLQRATMPAGPSGFHLFVPHVTGPLDL